ncbi:unnamed protein product [Symbiodinium sp. CCMP2592]|nr:unnamed protein product [Symbiodinium sp. CCMP2592]
MAEDEERPEKRQRLTPNDWESKILGSGDYSEVLPHNEVPFVNRHSELFDLFHVNEKNWGTAWQQELTQAQSAAMQHFDLRSCTTLSHVVYKLYGRTEGGPETVKIAEWIFNKVVECNTPLFVHFDEVGSLGANVRDLRDAVQQTWHPMLQCGGDMARIYFCLSGKSVPLTAVGGPASGVGTKWIILDLLQELMNLDMFQSLEQHIKYIIETSTQSDPLLLAFPGQATAATTGFAAVNRRHLRALHHLLKDQEGRDAEHFDAEKTMEEVYRILSNEVPQVASEIFLASRDEAEWRQTWLYLILLAQLRVPCHREMTLMNTR